ncbi:DNA-directed RNA polymerase III subunit RPC7-like [Saccostrea echinata]|uniref:DNA-directed RNA polymerase III subunit RPC7-like n=1 Tax=Saccostrea echinata TaxID=191078 RepID=UPI002A8245C6|nr:DNA-directed RNA polymerase III subunit RPC7-like [Saccostrea echinata]
MAGRGRGRGKNVSFNVEALGFGRGEALPGPISQPPPLFPIAEFKPIPFEQSEEFDYMLALKQEFLGNIRKSPFYLQAANKKKDIERYSDKYQVITEVNGKWKPDWRRLPAELKPKLPRKTKSKIKPTVKVKTMTKPSTVDVSKTLEELEKTEVEEKDEEEEEEGGGKKEEGTVEEEDEEIYDEEDIEEETDYILSYFDNGEEYGNDDDDADEGPVY